MTTATKVASVIVPEIFVPYVQQMTKEKSRFIQSGALVMNPVLSAMLAGGGLTFNIPSWKDLDATGSDADLVADDTAGDATPRGVGTSQEIAVRLSRAQGWSASDLSEALAGDDPMRAIADRVSTYWARCLQTIGINAVKGVFADNAAAPDASEHTQNDLTVDIKGASYSAGTTDFSASAFIDAVQTMGDARDDLAIVVMHSVVYSRAQKNNLIDFIPDSEGRVNIPTFLGHQVVVDDGMPAASGVYDTWIFGRGALQMGEGRPKVPVETKRNPEAYNGSGEEQLWSRNEWVIHPTGHAYVQASIPKGGPSNTNLATATSWQRVYPERKQIAIARLITREA